MKKLVIQTQYMENYAAHNEFYNPAIDAPHWKMKGGSTYVLPNCGDADVDAVVEAVSPFITCDNDYAMEYIIDAEVVPHSEKACEDWETVTEFTLLSGEPTFMKVTDNRENGWMKSEILEKVETWTGCLESDSGRKDYKAEFLMEDGDFCVGSHELKAWFELNKKVA
jgi:hypothetical protein